jgi:hypothetical protein
VGLAQAEADEHRLNKSFFQFAFNTGLTQPIGTFQRMLPDGHSLMSSASPLTIHDPRRFIFPKSALPCPTVIF